MRNPRPRLEYDLPDTFECVCDEAPEDCHCGDDPEEREDDDAYDRWRDSRLDDGRDS